MGGYEAEIVNRCVPFEKLGDKEEESWKGTEERVFVLFCSDLF